MGILVRELTDEGTIDHALGVLNAGGVVVLPTDTLYGFSAAIDADAAVRRIGVLKNVEPGRAYVLLAADAAMVSMWVHSFGCTSSSALSAVWPAPLTAVLPSGAGCPGWASPTVAFRVPDHALLRELIRRLGRPIVSTSVNRSGEAPLEDIDAIAARFGREIDLVVREGKVGARPSRGSTIVDFSGSAPRVLRRGDYDWAATGNGKPSK